MKRICLFLLLVLVLLTACRAEPEDTVSEPSKTDRWNDAVAGFDDLLLPVRAAFGEWFWDSGTSEETVELKNVTLLGKDRAFFDTLQAVCTTQKNRSQSMRSITLTSCGETLVYEHFSDAHGIVFALPTLFEGKYFSYRDPNAQQLLYEKLRHAFLKYADLEKLLQIENTETGTRYEMILDGEQLSLFLEDIGKIGLSSSFSVFFDSADTDVSGLPPKANRMTVALETNADSVPYLLNITLASGDETVGAFALTASFANEKTALHAVCSYGIQTASAELEYKTTGDRMKCKTRFAYGTLSLETDITVRMVSASEKTYDGTLLLGLHLNGAGVQIPITVSANSQKQSNTYKQTVSMSAKADALLTFDLFYEGTYAPSLPVITMPDATGTFGGEEIDVFANTHPSLYRLLAPFLYADM